MKKLCIIGLPRVFVGGIGFFYKYEKTGLVGLLTELTCSKEWMTGDVMRLGGVIGLSLK